MVTPIKVKFGPEVRPHAEALCELLEYANSRRDGKWAWMSQSPGNQGVYGAAYATLQAVVREEFGEAVANEAFTRLTVVKPNGLMESLEAAITDAVGACLEADEPVGPGTVVEPVTGWMVQYFDKTGGKWLDYQWYAGQGEASAAVRSLKVQGNKVRTLVRPRPEVDGSNDITVVAVDDPYLAAAATLHVGDRVHVVRGWAAKLTGTYVGVETCNGETVLLLEFGDSKQIIRVKPDEVSVGAQ